MEEKNTKKLETILWTEYDGEDIVDPGKLTEEEKEHAEKTIERLLKGTK